MTNKMLKKSFMLPLIIVIALALVIYKVKSRPAIEHQVLSFPTKAVEVITAKVLPFRSRAVAYGHVEPSVLLNTRTEVGGKISYIHPALKRGASLSKGTVVLRIEPTALEFSLDKSKAGLAGSESSLQQLKVEEASTRRSLTIAQQNLQTEEKELARLQQILQQDLVARSTVDTEAQKVLQLRQQLEDLRGRLASYASRQAAIKATIKQSQTQLSQSQDTLGRSEIKLPFDARIGAVLVEKGEYVSIGNPLFEALGTQAVEINAQLPIRQLYSLIAGTEKHKINLQNPEDLQAEFSKIQLEASISLVRVEGSTEKWPGKLVRIGESIDPTRDTATLVVAVDNPYNNVVPGQRPPLLKGMYTAVEFYTPPRDMLVLPRKAIHQGRVYIANTDNNLEIRTVKITHTQGQLVVIGDGINAGEKIIITDVIPVMEGLPLKPFHADSVEKQLAIDALGNAHTAALNH